MKTTGLIKNIFLIPLLVLILGLILVNCGDNDDDEVITLKLYETSKFSKIENLFATSVGISEDWAVVAISTNGYSLISFYNNSNTVWFHKSDQSGTLGFCDIPIISVDICGVYAVMGEIIDSSDLASGGAVHLYTNYSGRVSSKSNLGKFGASVAISGTNVIVGAPGVDKVYFYEIAVNGQLSNNNSFSNVDSESDFGHSVDIDGNYAIVGAYGDGVFGQAYIYQNVNGNWSKAAVLTNSSSYNNYGESVAICGDNAIVSANDGAQRATIFHNNGGQWTNVRYIDWPDNAQAGSVSVAISANYAVVGQVDGPEGRVRVYKNNNGSWDELSEQYIGGSYNNLPMGLALDDYHLVVGESQPGSGWVHFYE